MLYLFIFLTNTASGILTKAQPTKILKITEIMPDPIGLDADLEWIELNNQTDEDINLKNWSINAKSLPETILKSGQYLILASNPSKLKEQYKNTENIFSFITGLTNNGGKLYLTNQTNEVLQNFIYEQSKEGVSFELLEGDCATIQLNPLGNSIGQTNSDCISPSIVQITPTLNLIPTLLNLTIAQICPDPETGPEYLELKNISKDTIDLEGWILKDLSGHQQIFQSQIISANSQIKILTTNVSLNNDGDIIFLFDAFSRQIDILEYPNKLGHQCYPSISTPAIPITPTTNQLQCIDKAIDKSIPNTIKPTVKTYHFELPKLYMEKRY